MIWMAYVLEYKLQNCLSGNVILLHDLCMLVEGSSWISSVSIWRPRLDCDSSYRICSIPFFPSPSPFLIEGILLGMARTRGNPFFPLAGFPLACSKAWHVAFLLLVFSAECTHVSDGILLSLRDRKVPITLGNNFSGKLETRASLWLCDKNLTRDFLISHIIDYSPHFLDVQVLRVMDTREFMRSEHLTILEVPQVLPGYGQNYIKLDCEHQS